MRVLRWLATWRWPRSGLPEPAGDAAFHPTETMNTSTSPRAPAFDPWRDVDGIHICLQNRVEQVAVDSNHGALRERLHHRGCIVGRGTHLIYVRFDRGHQLVALRPHHVRVLDPDPDQSGKE